MAEFFGTNGNDTITPGLVTFGVVSVPFGAIPSVAADKLFGNGGDDILDGGGGNDTIFGDAGKDNISGGVGRDSLEGGVDDDVITGGAGSDTIFGASLLVPPGAGGLDNVTGGEGGDIIYSSGLGIYDGEGGNDTIRTASTTSETLRGGAGVGDTLDLFAVNIDATINLRTGANTFGKTIQGFEHLLTGIGNDDLTGNDGNNRLNSDIGDDALTGGAGADVLTGGAGADVFVFLDGDSTLGARDRITDFDKGNDLIDLTSVSGVMQFGDNLRADDSSANTNTIISGDIDGDGVDDFGVIVVDGAAVTASQWGSGDFLI